MDLNSGLLRTNIAIGLGGTLTRGLQLQVQRSNRSALCTWLIHIPLSLVIPGLAAGLGIEVGDECKLLAQEGVSRLSRILPTKSKFQ